ncbi:MAG: ABC transporter ATP-binding protein [Candidatus Methanoplasma sp.]|nr:ABC transporter ATP-binding protein [Candidatus Methanoplasma sp.]
MISLKGLSKAFNKKTAVDSIDLSIIKGEVFGFLGPNGAGKTTTIRLITTLLGKDSGTVMINGHDIDKDPIKAKTSIGVIQQQISLDNDLTVFENMVCHAKYHKIPKNIAMEKIERLIDYLDIEEYRNYKINNLSGGWKKRVSIAGALIHEPPILFLDEPTVGLDINGRRTIWDIVKQLNSDGTTVFLTTHYIEEAEVLCDRVAFINHGKIVEVDTPENLCIKVGSTAVEAFDGHKKTEYSYFSSREAANAYAGTLGSEYTVLIRNTNLEDCFVKMTGDSVGDQK